MLYLTKACQFNDTHLFFSGLWLFWRWLVLHLGLVGSSHLNPEKKSLFSTLSPLMLRELSLDMNITMKRVQVFSWRLLMPISVVVEAPAMVFPLVMLLVPVLDEMERDALTKWR